MHWHSTLRLDERKENLYIRWSVYCDSLCLPIRVVCGWLPCLAMIQLEDFFNFSISSSIIGPYHFYDWLYPATRTPDPWFEVYRISLSVLVWYSPTTAVVTSRREQFDLSPNAPSPWSGLPRILGAMHEEWSARPIQTKELKSVVATAFLGGQKTAITHNLQLLSTPCFFSWDIIVALSVWRE